MLETLSATIASLADTNPMLTLFAVLASSGVLKSTPAAIAPPVVHAEAAAEQGSPYREFERKLRRWEPIEGAEALDAFYDGSASKSPWGDPVAGHKLRMMSEQASPGDPGKALAKLFDAILRQIKTVYSRGLWSSEVQAVEGVFAQASARYEEWKKNGGNGTLDEKFRALKEAMSYLSEVSATLEALENKDSIEPEKIRILDQQLKALAIAVGIPPVEAQTLVAAAISRVAPPQEIQGDILGQISAARGFMRQNQLLQKYSDRLTALETALRLGMFKDARAMAEHFFDGANLIDQFMFHPAVIVMSDLLEQLNPFGNTNGIFLSNIQILSLELHAFGDIKTPEDFERRRRDLARGLETIGAVVPLSEADAKLLASGRDWQRNGGLIQSIGNFTGMLAPTALWLKGPLLTVVGLGGILPFFGKFIYGWGNHQERIARGDDSRPAKNPKLWGELIRNLARRFFR